MTGMVLSVMVTPFSVLADVQTEELPTGLLPVEEIAIKADDSELYESSDELLSETVVGCGEELLGCAGCGVHEVSDHRNRC